MTSTHDLTKSDGPRTYGNWAKPRSPGLPRLGLVGTVVLFAGLVLVVVVQLSFGFAAAGVMLLLAAGVLLPIVYRNRADRNGWQILVARIAWWRGVRSGRTTYLAALVQAPVHGGSMRLPGLLARSEVFAVKTATGEGFAMVSIPATRHYAVVLRAEPEGAALVDEDTVDLWVAHHGRWLAELAHEPGLVACSITVETAPDPGTRLQAEVSQLLREDAPDLARAMLIEAAADLPRGSASVRCWVTLVFSSTRPTTEERPATRGKRKDEASPTHVLVSSLPKPKAAPRGVRSPDEMGAQLAQRLPGLAAALRATGAGTVTAMTAEQVAEIPRVAYDPEAAPLVETAHARGQSSGVRWETAGPAALVEEWGSMHHDSGRSVTWQMVDAPAGAVQSRVLERLLAPSDLMSRKRVTLVYRPHDPASAAAIADRDVRTAIDLASARKGETRAGDSAYLTSARQTAAEQAAGAGLVRVSLLVTATVGEGQSLPAAAEAIDQLGAAARLRLRRCYGSQSASFAAALGLGIVLPAHVQIPSVLRDNL